MSNKTHESPKDFEAISHRGYVQEEPNYSDRNRSCLQGADPAVAAAIRDEEGWVTTGSDHLDCRIHAYHIKTGDMRSKERILDEWLWVQDRTERVNKTPFEKFLKAHTFEDGFVDGIGQWMSRALATQMVEHAPGVTGLHSTEILT